jgi:hypothetical protein
LKRNKIKTTISNHLRETIGHAFFHGPPTSSNKTFHLNLSGIFFLPDSSTRVLIGDVILFLHVRASPAWVWGQQVWRCRDEELGVYVVLKWSWPASWWPSQHCRLL